MKNTLGFLASSPLWKNTLFGLEQFKVPTIDLSTFKPQLIPEKLRLGHQIEHIFHQILSHSNTYEVVAHNIQVQKGNDTIGELDFIIRSCLPARQVRESRKLLHIELTYKFYIIDPTITDPIHSLIGPNKKDAFFAKLEKTKQKQLPLIHTKEGKQTLEKLEIEASTLTQQVLFLGQVFTPYNATITSIKPLNSDSIVGFWIRMNHFTSLIFKEYKYYVTYKHEWIHTPHQDVIWISHDDVLKVILNKHALKRAPMLWVKKDLKTIEKCFVVWW